MIYYVSDLHIGDETIFKKCNRPFKNVDEMKQTIIKKWNCKVSPDDIVYVLGDIADDNPKTIETYRLLNGHKHLIVGNHDHDILDDIRKSKIFESVKFIDLIEDNGRKVCICHHPLMDWMEFNRDGCLIYGHVHNKTGANGHAYEQIKKYYADKPAFNCGVDVNGFEPVTLDEMIKAKEDCKDDPYIH